MLKIPVSFQFLQEFREELSSQRAKLERIRERAQIRYPVIPADICRRLDEAHLSIQKEEERVTDTTFPVAYTFTMHQTQVYFL